MVSFWMYEKVVHLQKELKVVPDTEKRAVRINNFLKLCIMDDSKNYLSEQRNKLDDKIDKNAKIAIALFGIAAVLFLITPCYRRTEIGLGKGYVMGYQEMINVWAAVFSFAAAVYTLVLYIMFDSKGEEMSASFIPPAGIAGGAAIIFGGVWLFTGKSMAREISATMVGHYRVEYFGLVICFALLIIGATLLENGVDKPLKELKRVSNLLENQ